MIAYGGEGDRVYGIGAGNIDQKDSSSIVAYGGAGDFATGIFVQNNITQNESSSIVAYGGSGTNAYGIHVYQRIEIENKLTIARAGEAASVYTSSGVTMNSSSILVPIVDLAKDASLASGLIATSNATITSGAKLAPLFENTYMIEVGDSLSDIPFFETSSAITDSFVQPSDTITFNSVASLTVNNRNYVLEVTRNKTPREAFEDDGADEIYVTFVDDLYTVVTTRKEKAKPGLIKLLDAIDNSFNVAGAINAIDALPTYVTQLLYWNDVMTRVLDSNQFSTSNKIGALTGDGYGLFIEGSYMFGDNESIPGVDFGIVLQRKEVSLLVQGQIAKGNTKDSSEGSLFGITSVLNYRFNLGDIFNPEIGFNISYVSNSIEDSTTQSAFRIGLDIANAFKVGNISVKPMLGINYTPIKYVIPEVDENKLVSLNGRAGVEIGYQLTWFSIRASGYVSMDLLNKSFEERINSGEGMFAVANYFTPRSRLSWGAGVDAQFTLIPGLFGIEASYSIHAHGDYISHAVKAGINMTF